MKHLTLAAVSAAMALWGGTALAGCGLQSGSVRILSNDFPAVRAVTAAAAECAGEGVEVKSNHTAEHKDIQVAALTPNPAQYSVAVVANSSITPLINNGLIRPLDDLIARHAPDLPDTNKVTIGGKVMAVAFMANAQHLMARTDILQQIDRDVPATYDDVLADLKAIRDAGVMQYPFTSTTKAGWDVAEEFVNMYLGYGGDFFQPDSAAPAIANDKGVQTLNTLKALSEYADPDFLTFDSNAVQKQWEAGKVALATLWGTRAGDVLDDQGSTPEIVQSSVMAAAPTIAETGIPASSLWWDGFTISANISDADAEASFVAMIHGISDDVVRANNDDAVWLSPAYTPGPAAAGVAATIQAGARPYPMDPYMGLLHTVLGDEVPAFLQGRKTPEQTLSDIEAAYTAAAKAQGFLQ